MKTLLITILLFIFAFSPLLFVIAAAKLGFDIGNEVRGGLFDLVVFTPVTIIAALVIGFYLWLFSDSSVPHADQQSEAVSFWHLGDDEW